MVVGVDAQRVHRLDARVVDGLDLGVVVVARDERLDDGLHLGRRDALEDRSAAPFPALDAIDVVAPQPVLVRPREPHSERMYSATNGTWSLLIARLSSGSGRARRRALPASRPRKPTLRAKRRASRRFVITTLISPFA